LVPLDTSHTVAIWSLVQDQARSFQIAAACE
jgi:hypothetical protein